MPTGFEKNSGSKFCTELSNIRNNKDLFRGVLRTQSNIYDEAFFAKLTVFSQKHSIIDTRLGSKDISALEVLKLIFEIL